MIVKIIGEHSIWGKNKKSRRGERRGGLTLIRIILHHHKNFREHVQKEKEMVRTWQDQVPPLFYPGWEHTL
jgi:hypothetical protein